MHEYVRYVAPASATLPLVELKAQPAAAGGRSSTSKYMSSDQEREGAMPASAAKAWIRA